MKFSGPWKSLPVLVAVFAVAVGCGKPKYQKQNYSATAVAGQYTRPKLDVVVFQDNSDSVMYGPISTLKQQMQGFLSAMDSRWDIHFTVLPLLSTRSLANKYVIAQNCAEITGAYTCLSPSQASTFNNASGDYGWINSVDSSVGNNDKGFLNIYNNLSQASMVNSGFWRHDAAMAVVVISNGEDTTNVDMNVRSDGVQTGVNYNGSQTISSFNNYRNIFANLKGDPALSRFYSVVSTNGGSCYGYNSFRGLRYMNMADALGSRYYNLCNGELNGVLNDIGNQLNSMVEAIRFNYLVLSDKPLVNSITITKNGVAIPQSNVNGWSYVGYMSNQPTSYFPTAGNNRSGYFIKLNGTAEYKGTDLINVDYQKD